VTDTSWTLEPGSIALCAVLSAAYGVRWRAARKQGGTRAAPTWKLFIFASGILGLVAALMSPIDRLAEQLLAMHMVQHLLLLDIVPILLILSLTKMILRPVTPRLHRLELAVGPFASPVFAIVAYVVLMWAWHVPALYDTALEHPTIHVLEHVTFLSIGILYWWHLLSPVRSHLRFGGLAPVSYMATTKVLVGALGIALTFATVPLYDFYEHGARHWGLSALDDQALAGAIMAIEQSIVMGIALAYLFIRALQESEAAELRAERYAATDPADPNLSASSSISDAGTGSANKKP
jgi:putative membrane protein